MQALRESPWLHRALFGGLCLILGELIAWQGAARYGPLDWLALWLIYSALGAAALDAIARYRVTTPSTLMLVAGGFGLGHAMLTGTINISAGTQAFVVDLILLPLGAMPLVFLVALGSLRALLSGEAVGLRAFIGAGLVGIAWGIWLRGFNDIESITIRTTTLAENAPFVLIGLALIGLVTWAVSPQRYTNDYDWRLSPYDAVAVGLVLGVTLLLRLDAAYVDTLGASILASLLVIITLMVVFTRNIRPADALTDITPPQKPHLPSWFLLGLPLLAGGGAAWEFGAGDPFFVAGMFQALLVFGTLWLPLASAQLGVAAMARLTQEGY
ncbi:MAG: hypothetical protein ACLFTK_02985 [Anaerolineales bacterium]